MISRYYLKFVALIIIVLCLMQPLACFEHPCASCLGALDTSNTHDAPGDRTHNHDQDNCDSSVCCAEYVNMNDRTIVVYSPVISKLAPFEKHQQLPDIVASIYIPPRHVS